MITLDLLDINFYIFTVIKILFNLWVRINYILIKNFNILTFNLKEFYCLYLQYRFLLNKASWNNSKTDAPSSVENKIGKLYSASFYSSSQTPTFSARECIVLQYLLNVVTGVNSEKDINLQNWTSSVFNSFSFTPKILAKLVFVKWWSSINFAETIIDDSNNLCTVLMVNNCGCWVMILSIYIMLWTNVAVDILPNFKIRLQ